MKLRNKKTGIIGELHFEPDKEYHFTVAPEDPADMMIYKKLADLYADWGDYEEPKGIQDVYNVKDYVYIKMSSEEEAEKAVEKLKAWKRLKDKGVYFTRMKAHHHCIAINGWARDDIKRDLDILFGGEE